MYTTELKNEVTAKLIARNGSTNPWIYRSHYVAANNLESLLCDVINSTQFVTSGRLDERIYCILHDITQVPTCYCGTPLKFKRFLLGYAEYCSVKCRANSTKWQQQVASSNLEKYGVTHVAQLSNERDKRSNRMKQIRPSMDMKKAACNRRATIERLYGKGYNAGWTDKAIQTRVNNGNMVPVELRDEYRDYYDTVVRITNKQDLSTLTNIEKRGVIGKDDDAHHIDHMFSIYDGFMNDVPADIIGNICNLHCIPGSANIKKRNNSWITLKELYDRYEQQIGI